MRPAVTHTNTRWAAREPAIHSANVNHQSAAGIRTRTKKKKMLRSSPSNRRSKLLSFPYAAHSQEERERIHQKCRGLSIQDVYIASWDGEEEEGKKFLRD